MTRALRSEDSKREKIEPVLLRFTSLRKSAKGAIQGSPGQRPGKNTNAKKTSPEGALKAMLRIGMLWLLFMPTSNRISDVIVRKSIIKYEKNFSRSLQKIHLKKSLRC